MSASTVYLILQSSRRKKHYVSYPVKQKVIKAVENVKPTPEQIAQAEENTTFYIHLWAFVTFIIILGMIILY